MRRATTTAALSSSRHSHTPIPTAVGVSVFNLPLAPTTTPGDRWDALIYKCRSTILLLAACAATAVSRARADSRFSAVGSGPEVCLARAGVGS